MHRFAALVVVSPFVFLLSSVFLMASAPPPCVKAGSSPSGNFLVVSETEYQPGDNSPGGPRRVQQVTLEVFPKETFINEKDRIVSQNRFWNSHPQWSVVLSSANTKPFVGACPLALVTDDGEFLVIVNLYVLDGYPALRIYHRRDHLGDPMREGPDHGVPVKDISLKEIWPATKLPDTITDSSPQWFAGGTFEFSADSRVLVHKTRWGTTVRINLMDGSVSIGRTG